MLMLALASMMKINLCVATASYNRIKLELRSVKIKV